MNGESVRIPRWLLCSVFVLTSVSAPLADVFVVRPNNQIIGTLVGQNDLELVINSFGTELRIRRADLIEIIPSGTTPPPVAPAVTSPVTPVVSQTETPTGDLQLTATPPPLDPSQMPETVPLLPVTLPGKAVYTVTGYGVSYRRGPSTEYETITRLQSRDLLLGLETVDDWLRARTIADPPVEGWIHPSYFQPMENVPTVVDGVRVNVRELPSLMGRIVGGLNTGDMVLKLEEEGEWWHVLVDETTAGWCKAEFLEPLTNPALYRPPVQIINNRESGLPVVKEAFVNSMGQGRFLFTLRDERLVQSGKTNLLVFYPPGSDVQTEEAALTSESILNRITFVGLDAMKALGLPDELLQNHVAAETYTMLGERVADGWRYEVRGAEMNRVYGFMVQQGPSRGTLILVD